MARIGILGGTFNPPHIGHLVCAQEAVCRLALDRVVLMPVGVPPHKALPDDPGPEHRLEMARVATARDERLGASGLELERDGPSYTVDTLRAIHDRDPGDELTFIVGGDMAASFATWREPEAVLELAALAVAERAGARREELAAALADVRGGDGARFFDMPRLDVSSTDVRARVRAGLPIRYLVPDEVVGYIGAHGLYREAGA